MSTTTTREKAAAHEALYLRLEALHRQLAELAARHPDTAVTPAVRILAESLLYDTHPFVAGHTRGLVAAAGTQATLAVQLGQALAALSLWEAAHSGWNGEFYVWRFTQGDPEPIQRLRPKAKSALRTPEQVRETEDRRQQIIHMIDAKFDAGYRTGYEDGKLGIAPRPDEFSVAARIARLNQG